MAHEITLQNSSDTALQIPLSETWSYAVLDSWLVAQFVEHNGSMSMLILKVC